MFSFTCGKCWCLAGRWDLLVLFVLSTTETEWALAVVETGDCCPKSWLVEKDRYLSECLSIPSILCCFPMSCTMLAVVKSRQQEQGLSMSPAQEVLQSCALSMGATSLQVLFACVFFFLTLTSPFGRRGDVSSYSIELWGSLDDKCCGGLRVGSSLEP